MINANVCLDLNAGSNYGMSAQHIMDEHITAGLVGAPPLLPLWPRRVRAAVFTPGRAWRSEPGARSLALGAATLRAHMWRGQSSARTGRASLSERSPLFCHVTGASCGPRSPTLRLGFGGSCDRTSLLQDAASCRQTAALSCRGSAGSSGANCVGEEDCFGHNEGSVC